MAVVFDFIASLFEVILSRRSLVASMLRFRFLLFSEAVEAFLAIFL